MFASEMEPLLRVLTLRALTAIDDPRPTCWTWPTALTLKTPELVTLERSTVPPDVTFVAPVPA